MQDELYTYDPDRLTGQREIKPQDRTEAEKQGARGNFQSLWWWNFWLPKAGRKLNDSSRNQLWQQWEPRLSHSTMVGVLPDALLAPQFLIPSFTSCWCSFPPHLVLSSKYKKWSWQHDILSCQQHKIIEMPPPSRFLSPAFISEAHKIPVKGEKCPTHLWVNGTCKIWNGNCKNAGKDYRIM